MLFYRDFDGGIDWHVWQRADGWETRRRRNTRHRPQIARGEVREIHDVVCVVYGEKRLVPLPLLLPLIPDLLLQPVSKNIISKLKIMFSIKTFFQLTDLPGAELLFFLAFALRRLTNGNQPPGFESHEEETDIMTHAKREPNLRFGRRIIL